jgi:hypothetical protein
MSYMVDKITGRDFSCRLKNIFLCISIKGRNPLTKVLVRNSVTMKFGFFYLVRD